MKGAGIATGIDGWRVTYKTSHFKEYTVAARDARVLRISDQREKKVMSDVTIHDHKPPIVVLREKLETRKGELQKALVDIDADHFIRTMITAATIDPNLQACSFNSLWIACLRACRDQLLPDGREGVIIPFKDKATWVPMYQGLLKRFRDSGECKWITANVVRDGEMFTHYIDQTGEHFHHIPDGNEKSPIIKVYGAALTKDGAFYVAVMSMSEIEEIKKESRANRPDSPWQKHAGEMMKKTALRRLSKLLPAGRNIFQQEEEQEQDERKQVTTPQLAVDNERPAGAAAALESFAGPPPELAEPGAIEDALSIAFERGQIARQTGAARRAIPGEYREEANKAEADAWLAGYDTKDGSNADEVP